MQAQNAAILLVLGMSAALALVAGISYASYNRGGLSLTLSRPFTDWRDVKNYYYNSLAGQNYTLPDTSTNLMLATAWCNYSSPRPGIVPQNRSDACGCLYRKHQAFLANRTANVLFPTDITRAAGDDAINCLRYRSVWDVSKCGHQCRVNPAVLAFTSNLAVLIPCVACALGVFAPGLNQYLVFFIAAIPMLLGVGLLEGMRVVENLIYALALLGIYAGVVLGLDGELIPDAMMQTTNSGYGRAGRRNAIIGNLGNIQIKQAPVIMIAVWHALPLVYTLAVVYLAVAHTVRDLAGVLGYALIGFITGFLAQRLFWTRWNLMIALPEANRSESSLKLAYAFVTWIGWCVRVGLVVAWTFIFVLAYTQWFPSSPYYGSYNSLVILILLCILALFECLLYSGIPYNNADTPFGWAEILQLSLLILANTLFTALAVADLGLNAE